MNPDLLKLLGGIMLQLARGGTYVNIPQLAQSFSHTFADVTPEGAARQAAYSYPFATILGVDLIGDVHAADVAANLNVAPYDPSVHPGFSYYSVRMMQ